MIEMNVWHRNFDTKTIISLFDILNGYNPIISDLIKAHLRKDVNVSSYKLIGLDNNIIYQTFNLQWLIILYCVNKKLLYLHFVLFEKKNPLQKTEVSKII